MTRINNITSITIIGCEVSHDMLHFDDVKRVCGRDRPKPNRTGAYDATDLTDCPLEESGMDYDQLGFVSCPYCHGSITQGKNTPLYQVDEKDGEKYITTDEHASFDLLVFSTSPDGNSSDRWVVGKYVGGVRSEHDIAHMAYSDMTRARNEIKAALEPLGLWREHNFGVHTFFQLNGE